jgi:hypothetical protein
MSRIPLHRSHAARYLRLMQGVAVLLLAGSILALVRVDLPAPARPESESPGIQNWTVEVSDKGEPAAVFVDPDAIAIRFGAITEEADPGQGGEDLAADEPASGFGDIRYLGAVIEPDRRVALLAVDGRQRMLAEGRQFESTRGTFTLEQVSEDLVLIGIDGMTQRVRKANKAADATIGQLAAVTTPAGNANDDANRRIDPKRLDRTDPQYLADLERRREEARRRREEYTSGRTVSPVTPDEQPSRPREPSAAERMGGESPDRD